MSTKPESGKNQAANIPYFDTHALVDIKNIAVDRSLSPEHRMNRFIQQVRNPYLFQVGDVTVQIEYAGGKSLTEALVNILASG